MTMVNNEPFANAYAVAAIDALMDQSYQGYETSTYVFGKFIQLGLVFLAFIPRH